MNKTEIESRLYAKSVGAKDEAPMSDGANGKEAKMKKKILALLMAAVLTLGVCAPAFGASGTNDNSGSITIDNAVVGQEYSVYQILKLESYDAEADAYSYKAIEAWEPWLKTQTEYVSFNEQGYVTWVKDADQAAFAKAAQKYAKENDLSKQGSSTATSATVEFKNLNLGYYLVDTTLGTICSLDTTNPSVTMKEKNGVPANVKTVEEDSTGVYGATNDADLGQTINFRSTITAQAGAVNYVLHDKMSAGLTFGSVTGITLNEDAVDAGSYLVKTAGFSDDCTFEVIFTQKFCDTLKANDEIVVSYTAALNEEAVVGLPGNPNETHLSYGEFSSDSGKPSGETLPSKTTTYAWDMDVLKYGNGDESKVLKDAQFVLLNKDTSKVAKVVGGKFAGWLDVPAADEGSPIVWPEGAVLTTGDLGKIEIDGLDSDTYYLREVKAPAGYNVLAEDVKVEVKGATKADGSDGLTYSTVVAKVNNQSGVELPSTGGIGTTLFYAVGGLLVVGAVVLLIMRRRAGSEE